MSEEPSLSARVVGGEFSSPNMGRSVKDLELGRKAVWSEAPTENGMHARHSTDEGDKDDGVSEGDSSTSEIPESFADIQTRQSEYSGISTEGVGVRRH